MPQFSLVRKEADRANADSRVVDKGGEMPLWHSTVRSQTPKLQGRQRVAPIPKRSLREKYRKRFALHRRAGQNWSVP